MTILNIILQARSNPFEFAFVPLLILLVIIVLVAIKTSISSDEGTVSADQLNKVINVTLIGGLIGLFASSPQRALNNRIKKENAARK